jgi:hypothetical protein
MVTAASVRRQALSIEGVTEQPHFDMTSFRLGKRIFITLNKTNTKICIKLTPEDQDLFSLHDRKTIYAVPNAWGKQGWTFVELKKVRAAVMKDLLAAALEGLKKKPARKR